MGFTEFRLWLVGIFHFSTVKVLKDLCFGRNPSEYHQDEHFHRVKWVWFTNALNWKLWQGPADRPGAEFCIIVPSNPDFSQVYSIPCLFPENTLFTSCSWGCVSISPENRQVLPASRGFLIIFLLEPHTQHSEMVPNNLTLALFFPAGAWGVWGI